MDQIEVKILNPDVIDEAEKMMVCAARLTQKGHKIQNMEDFIELFEREYKPETAETMTALPHPTIQKFGAINVVVIGASRRFLAQITRHQNEVKFMSASLQYSDYSGEAAFVVPYSIKKAGQEFVDEYLKACRASMQAYANAIDVGIDNDAAGYLAPQGLQNILIISATPYQWAHMIRQRVCRRNTAETRYVMLKIWKELYAHNSILFGIRNAAPPCVCFNCPEGKMTCGNLIWEAQAAPSELLKADFPLIN